ncbi:MAG: hypothetical protein QXP36_10865 [Conexivisphaerales archaeon]
MTLGISSGFPSLPNGCSFFRASYVASLFQVFSANPETMGYPPDKQEKATVTVLEQAKRLGYEWVS